jgi:glyoxylase-like metal-dependent hydrolase (beta-lactamase superfamily II)
MIHIASFTFGPFEENTYILYDETKECVIIDPGCQSIEEKNTLAHYIEEHKLKPVKLLLTHTHIDHILGNNFVCGKYNLKPEINKLELPMLQNAKMIGDMYGIATEPSPDAEVFLTEKDTVRFGNSELKILFIPGHSPGALCFYHSKEKFVIAGDVLFYESIGRTDLPGGDYAALIKGIREKLFTLADDFKVYSGHGPSTTIGHEKKHNPFLT